MRRRSGAVVALVALAGLGAMLSGCGPAPWNAGESEPSASVRSSSPVPAPVSNDLSSGSTQREVQAGSVTATIEYWSELSMDKWTATALKPVSLSMITTVTPNDGQKVYLQKASMVAVPGNGSTSFEALAAQVDQAANPGYFVLDPYSYSQTFTVGEVPADATFVQVQFTYEFLVQTTPTSADYAKQTASDILTIAISGGGQE